MTVASMLHQTWGDVCVRLEMRVLAALPTSLKKEQRTGRSQCDLSRFEDLSRVWLSDLRPCEQWHNVNRAPRLQRRCPLATSSQGFGVEGLAARPCLLGGHPTKVMEKVLSVNIPSVHLREQRHSA